MIKQFHFRFCQVRIFALAMDPERRNGGGETARARMSNETTAREHEGKVTFAISNDPPDLTLDEDKLTSSSSHAPCVMK